MTTEERLNRIDTLVAQDPVYKEMLLEGTLLEQGLADSMRRLSRKNYNKVWDFIMYCEDMSRYALKLACKNMIFPQEHEN